MDDTRHSFLRHMLATIAYRGGRALRGVTDDVATYCACDGARTPLEIVAHLGDLFAWVLSILDRAETFEGSTPGTWSAEVDRFYDLLARVDERLASVDALPVREEQLLQGPFADALTHIGQIAMLRGIAGVPVRGENYFIAEVRAGAVGPVQPAPAYEF